MDDRYRGHGYQGGGYRAGGYGGGASDRSALHCDSMLSGAGHRGPSYAPASRQQQTNTATSSDALRKLSAQLHGMIEETKSMKSTGEVEPVQRHYDRRSEPERAPVEASRSPNSRPMPAHLAREAVSSRQPYVRPVEMDNEYLSHRPNYGGEMVQTAHGAPAGAEDIKMRLKIQSLERQNSKLQEALKSREEEMQHLAAAQQSELEHRTQQLLAEQESLAGTIVELRKLSNAVTEENSSLRHQCENQERELLASVAKEMEELRRSSATLNEENTELRRQYESNTSEFAALEASHGELQSRLSAAEATVQELTSQSDSSKQYADMFREKLTQQVSSLSQEIASLNQQLEQKDGAIGEFQLQLTELQGSESERLAAQEQRLQQVTGRLMEEKNALQVQLNTEMENNRQMHTRLVSQQDHVHELENQLSHAGSQSTAELRSVRQDFLKERDRAQQASQEKDSLLKQLQDVHKKYTALVEEQQGVKGEMRKLWDTNKEMAASLNERSTLLHQAQTEAAHARERSDAVGRENLMLREQLQHMLEAATGKPEASTGQAENGIGEGSEIQSLGHALQRLQSERDHILSEFHRHSQVYQNHIASLKKKLARTQGAAAPIVNGMSETPPADGQLASGPVNGAVAAAACPSCAKLQEHVDLQQQTVVEVQARFAEVMVEKAELVQTLQAMEHRIVQLEVETDTIGEYITVYRSQREELLSQFGEKRKLISWLQTERSSVVCLLHQLNDWAQYGAITEPNAHPTTSTATTASGHDVNGISRSSSASQVDTNASFATATRGQQPERSTSELMQRLVDVIFYLCQGEPLASDSAHRPSQGTSSRPPVVVGKTSMPSPHRSPAARSGGGSGHQSPIHPVNASRSPVANAQDFCVPRATVHSDVYAV